MKASRTALRFACAALAAMACLPAYAVYRCDENGKLTYSDQPCKAGAKATQKDYGTLDLQVATVVYEVRGRDYGALTQSLRASGPKGFHGHANWKVGYRYTTRRQAAGCQVDTVTVKLEGEILMPRWVDENAAPKELQQRWRDYYTALKRHEDGHIQNGRELAQLLKERLAGMGVAPCERVQGMADAEFQRLLVDYRSRDREYDERTRHGATQGAQF